MTHADPMTNLDTKHGADERISTAGLHFQTRAAIAVARTIGALGRADGSVARPAGSSMRGLG